MRDDLLSAILARYPDETALRSAECLSVVEALASQLTTDIAAIESKHSTNREFSLLRSKGWLSSLETLSARFVIQHFGLPKSEPKSKRKKPATRVKKKRGGGGAFRAFISVSCRGQKGRVDFREMKRRFRQLSQADLQRYQEIGAHGTRAHKRGHAAFGTKKRKRTTRLVSKFRAVQDAFPPPAGIRDRPEAEAVPDVDQALLESAEQQLQRQQAEVHVCARRLQRGTQSSWKR